MFGCRRTVRTTLTQLGKQFDYLFAVTPRIFIGFVKLFGSVRQANIIVSQLMSLTVLGEQLVPYIRCTRLVKLKSAHSPALVIHNFYSNHKFKIYDFSAKQGHMCCITVVFKYYSNKHCKKIIWQTLKLFIMTHRGVQ